MKMFIWMFIALVLGTAIGAFGTDYKFRTDFEAISGINWYNFNATHDDCTITFKEECKLYGGFAPKSQFQ